MDHVILDLGSDANVLPKHTWEHIGNTKLQWSPIQLGMANQENIMPMGCLHGVTVDIEGVRVVANFKVIDIIADSNPYPTFLRIDWAFDMNTIINELQVFEKNKLQVIIPLDPSKGSRYTELNRDYYEDDEIEHIYQLMMWNEDWINPTVDGRINWEKDNSCQLDLNEELENLHNRDSRRFGGNEDKFKT